MFEETLRGGGGDRRGFARDHTGEQIRTRTEEVGFEATFRCPDRGIWTNVPHVHVVTKKQGSA